VDGLYCKGHDPEVVRARHDARRARYEAKSAAQDLDLAIQRARHRVSECACMVYRQEAAMDDLEIAVTALEALLRRLPVGGAVV
jgi:hypothetical protein